MARSACSSIKKATCGRTRCRRQPKGLSTSGHNRYTMADSDYMFIGGEPIEVGSEGQNDSLFSSGDHVLDDGDSEYVFEEGTGVGIASLTDVQVYDGWSTDDPLIIEYDIEFNDQAPAPGTKTSVGFHSSDGNQELERVELEDGTTVEDFNDCRGVDTYFDRGDAGFAGPTNTPSEYWSIVNSNEGCKLRETHFGTSTQISGSVAQDGLQYYPEWGKTTYWYIHVDNDKDPGIILGGDAVTPGFQMQYTLSNEQFSTQGDWCDGVRTHVPLDSSDYPAGKQLWVVSTS